MKKIALVLISIIMPYAGMYFPEGLYIGYQSSNKIHNSVGDFDEEYKNRSIEFSYLFPGKVFEVIGRYNNEKKIRYNYNLYKAETPVTTIGGAIYLINEDAVVRLMIKGEYSFGAISYNTNIGGSMANDGVGGATIDDDDYYSVEKIGARFFSRLPTQITLFPFRATFFIGYNFLRKKITDIEIIINYESETILGFGFTFGRILIEPSFKKYDKENFYDIRLGIKF